LGVFSRLTTQFNVGPMGGVVGLRYEAIPIVLRLLQVPRAECPKLFEQLRVCESEALTIWNAA
jgi:hypothetical protein